MVIQMVILFVCIIIFNWLPTLVDDVLEQADSSKNDFSHVKLPSIETLDLGDFIWILDDLHQVLQAAILFLSLNDKKT